MNNCFWWSCILKLKKCYVIKWFDWCYFCCLIVYSYRLKNVNHNSILNSYVRFTSDFRSKLIFLLSSTLNHFMILVLTIFTVNIWNKKDEIIKNEFESDSVVKTKCQLCDFYWLMKHLHSAPNTRTNNNIVSNIIFHSDSPMRNIVKCKPVFEKENFLKKHVKITLIMTSSIPFFPQLFLILNYPFCLYPTCLPIEYFISRNWGWFSHTWKWNLPRSCFLVWCSIYWNESRNMAQYFTDRTTNALVPSTLFAWKSFVLQKRSALVW